MSAFGGKADIPTRSINVRFFGAHILILHEFSTFPLGYPHAYPPGRICPLFAKHSPPMLLARFVGDARPR
jgi:hypothetical protein